MTFVGLENFVEMPQDSVFKCAFEHNLFYVVVNTVTTVVLAMIVAVALTGKVRGGGFFRTTYLYEVSFINSHYGYGTAIGIVLFFITLIVTLISLGLTRRERVEYA